MENRSKMKDNQDTLICTFCGKPMPTRTNKIGGSKKYCSTKCRDRAHYWRNPERRRELRREQRKRDKKKDPEKVKKIDNERRIRYFEKDPERKREYDRKRRREDPEKMRRLAKESRKRRIEKDPEGMKRFEKEHYWRYKDSDRRRVLDKIAREKAKMEGLAHYGAYCHCPGCGETRTEFLTMEHIGGIAKGYTRHSGVWLKAKSDEWPDDITVLCYNCNCSKGHLGYCPHERERVSEGI